LNKDPLIIYWSPYSSADTDLVGEFNLLHPEPENVYASLVRRMPDSRNERSLQTYMSCPAASARLKNMWVFKAPFDMEYGFDFTDPDNPQVWNISEGYFNFQVNRKSVIKDAAIVSFSIKHLLFAEESVTPLFGPPVMFRPQYMNYGTSVPGAFDISQWFRPHVFEVQMWEKAGTFKLKEGEPLFTVEFITNRPIVFKKFVMSEALVKYADSCVDSHKFFGQWLGLAKKYNIFKDTKMDKLVLKEIKNNLVD
jgi:hypothetical protein